MVKLLYPCEGIGEVSDGFDVSISSRDNRRALADGDRLVRRRY
jgi:hypothetical protein